MTNVLFKRLIAALICLLAVTVCAAVPAAAEGFRAVTIQGGDQGALVIDVRDKQGALLIRQGNYTITCILATKKRWQRLTAAWQDVQAAAEESRRPSMSVIKMNGDTRVSFEFDKNVKISLIDETRSTTFTIYSEDYEVFRSAIEKVLARLEE